MTTRQRVQSIPSGFSTLHPNNSSFITHLFIIPSFKLPEAFKNLIDVECGSD